MVAEWLMEVATGLVSFICGLFPAWTAPDWFLTFDDLWASMTGGLDPLGAWLDLNLVGTVLGVLLATWGVCATIKLILRGVSHVPGAGGAG